jgi:FADH2 O2-dependent halogenase
LNAHYDIAVVGSGFAGSLIAMIARRLGYSVVLVDKGRHPRVVIGESSTPLTNLLLEELATRYDLPAIVPLTKWGSWQSSYPAIACGLKRGFTFYHHDLNHPVEHKARREHQLLVAASPNDRIADTHWYRADFDHFLANQAVAIGVDYIDEFVFRSLTQSSTHIDITGTREEKSIDIIARFVIDASGPRGFLHRALALREQDLPAYPATQALYGHFVGVSRLEDQSFGRNSEIPPYPIDDAAVHHVFDGGWVWVLQFNNGVTSAGIAATEPLAASLDLAAGPMAWQRLLSKIPALREQFAEATIEHPLTHIPRLSFHSSESFGKRWAMLPSAAGFVDPLLSTGFPMTLLGVARIAEILERDWDSDNFPASLATYAYQTEAELFATSRLIGSLYANMGDFPVFSALTLLYFAAASYSEAARRLGKRHLSSSFLLHDHPGFGAACLDLAKRAQVGCTQQASKKLIQETLRAIEPINIAGLGNPARNNWYPVDAEDMFHAASKLEATQAEITELLDRCGFSMTEQACAATDRRT